MSSFATKFVQTVLLTTKEVDPEIYYPILNQKLYGNGNNCYQQFYTIEELEASLLSANWQETSHSAILVGYRVFKANIPANTGIIFIPNAPKNTIFQADDPLGTKKVHLVISENAHGIRDLINETYLVVNPNIRLHSLNPGTPIKHSIVKTSVIKHGDPVTKSTGLYLGWEWARII